MSIYLSRMYEDMHNAWWVDDSKRQSPTQPARHYNVDTAGTNHAMVSGWQQTSVSPHNLLATMPSIQQGQTSPWWVDDSKRQSPHTTCSPQRRQYSRDKPHRGEWMTGNVSLPTQPARHNAVNTAGTNHAAGWNRHSCSTARHGTAQQWQL